MTTNIEISFNEGEYYFDVEPCPFCGSDDVEIPETRVGTILYIVYVECSVCQAKGSIYYPADVEHIQKAGNTWNGVSR